MLEVLKVMMKEEWRIHSSLYGGKLFAFFPLMIGICTFISCLFLPYLQVVMPTRQLVMLAHYLFILFGMSVGAFGLFGKEVMNRRFGQASLIAYSSRSLPISDRNIFLNFFIKDIIYYFILWIIPILMGLTLSMPIISKSIPYALFISATLVLSFLIGISLVFFLSTLYAHSSKILMGVILILITTVLFMTQYYSIDITMLLPSFTLFLYPTPTLFFISVTFIIIPSSLSFIFLKIDYPEKKKQFKNSIISLSKRFQFSKYSYFIAKDFLDLKRSEGGIGKIIFSFLFPITLTWLFLHIFFEYIPTVNVLMIFALFLGIVSSSMYNWLTEFDSFTSYNFLPVKVSTIIKSKLTSYLLINIFSVFILITIAIGTNQLFYLIPALLSFISVSFYALTMMIYFAGLHPNILLYNPKIFSRYAFSVAPALFILTFVSIFNPYYLLLSPVLLIISFFVIKKSYTKWNNWQPISY